MASAHARETSQRSSSTGGVRRKRSTRWTTSLSTCAVSAKNERPCWRSPTAGGCSSRMKACSSRRGSSVGGPRRLCLRSVSIRGRAGSAVFQRARVSDRTDLRTGRSARRIGSISRTSITSAGPATAGTKRIAQMLSFYPIDPRGLVASEQSHPQPLQDGFRASIYTTRLYRLARISP